MATKKAAKKKTAAKKQTPRVFAVPVEQSVILNDLCTVVTDSLDEFAESVGFIARELGVPSDGSYVINTGFTEFVPAEVYAKRA